MPGERGGKGYGKKQVEVLIQIKLQDLLILEIYTEMPNSLTKSLKRATARFPTAQPYLAQPYLSAGAV